MERIIVTKVYPNQERVVIGIFKGNASESSMTFNLHGQIFPENTKIGDELVFTKKIDVYPFPTRGMN